MTQLLTAAQMRAIEEAAMKSGAVTGLALMERAGQGVVGEVFKWQPDLGEGTHRATILCGPGNNGGDGYVIARLLEARGWEVVLLALTAPKTPDAQAMAQSWGGTTRPLTLAELKAQPAADLYVDAIFGTGLTRAPDGDLLKLLQHFAGDPGHFSARLVAVDAPSGLCLDSGRQLALGTSQAIGGTVPLAGLTVTFECPKIGHFIADGPTLCGQLAVVDLGLAAWRGPTEPDESRGSDLHTPRVHLVDQRPWGAPGADGHSALDLRFDKPSGHKFDHGHCLVLSGGFGKTGAARLAARAALRIGAGLVTVGAPAEAMAECAAQLTAIMLREVTTADDLVAVLEDPRITSVCIGPGLGLTESDGAKVAVALESRKAVVLDADALTLVARDASLRDRLHSSCVLTPHAGEFRRLWPDLSDRLLPTGQDAKRQGTSAFEAANPAGKVSGLTGPAPSKVDVTREAAQRVGATLLFKGVDTVIAAPFGTAFVHAAAHGRAAPWLATAGAGDVLAGLIAGRLAQDATAPAVTAATMAWLHIEAARAFGPGLIAEDLPDRIPQVLSEAAGASPAYG